MNTLMLALQQPLSKDILVTWAARLGWAAGCLPTPAVRRRKPRGAVRGADGVPAATALDDTLPCGWFNSSHELQQGLMVLEHSATDGLGAELPLAAWLDGMLKTPEVCVRA